MSSTLTHFDNQGQAHMVDVGGKDDTLPVKRESRRAMRKKEMF